MDAISLLHLVLRWLLVLIGAGAWLWLAAMLLALAGWTLWGAHQAVARVRRSVGSVARSRQAPAAHKAAQTRRDPVFQMIRRR